MAIVQSIFRMSVQDRSRYTRTGGTSEIAREIPTDQEAEAVNDRVDLDAVEIFTHWCDPDRALAALIASLSKTEAEIDALPPAEQVRASRQAIWLFAKTFMLLNVRLRSWGLFRRVAEKVFGASYHARKTGNPGNDGGFSVNGDLWKTIYELAGACDCSGFPAGRWPETTTVGLRGETGQGDGPPMHQAWIEADNSVTVRPNVAGYNEARDITTPGSPRNVRAASGGWRTLRFTKWADPDPSEQGYHAYGLPTLRDYWGIFFDPVPGLKFRPDGSTLPEDLFPIFPQRWDSPAYQAQMRALRESGAAGRDLSLAEYVAMAGFQAVIREVRMTVMLHNNVLASQLGGRTFSEAIEDELHVDMERERVDRERITALAGAGNKVAETLSVVPNPYSAAVAVSIGAASAVAKGLALAGITPASAPLDTFGDPVVVRGGQAMPALVFLAFDNRSDRLTTLQGVVGRARALNHSFGLPSEDPGVECVTTWLGDGGCRARGTPLADYISSGAVSDRVRALLRSGTWIRPKSTPPLNLFLFLPQPEDGGGKAGGRKSIFVLPTPSPLLTEPPLTDAAPDELGTLPPDPDALQGNVVEDGQLRSGFVRRVLPWIGAAVAVTGVAAGVAIVVSKRSGDDGDGGPR